MPSVIGGAPFIPLIPTAPAASESESSFAITANTFFLAVYLMVREVNSVLVGISITALPAPPLALDPTFAADADTFVASLPGLVTDVNAIITALSLPCSAVTALPTTPSRGGDPVDFPTRAAAEVAALPTFRTQLNAFITALNAYDPAAPLGTHIGWRIYISANNGDTTYTSLREAQLRTVSGGSSVTSGGTAFQGGPGTDAGSGAGAPWDGNTTNSWKRTISGGYGFYFGYLFASPTAIVELAIMASTGEAPAGFKLQYSDDTTNGTDGTWHDTFTAFENSWDLSTDQYRVWPQDFTGSKYKAFRFYVTANNGDTAIAMTEAEFHATVGGSDFSTPSTGFGTVTGSNAEPYRLFDNSDSFRWVFGVSGNLPAWCANALVTPHVKPVEYTLRNTDGSARAWADWKLQGSVDGVTWTDLDTRSGVTWSSSTETKTFTVP